MPQQLNNDDWVDDDPNWQDDTASPSLWERANTPLTTLPSDIARNIGDTMTTPSLNDSVWGSRIRGFGAGALQGVGDLVSGLTSPLGLATTVATAGEGTALKAGLPAIGKALGYGAKAAGSLYAGHGAIETGAGALEGDIGRAGKGLVEMAGGITGMHGIKPKVANSSAILSDLERTAGEFKPPRADLSKMAPDELAQLRDFMGQGVTEAETADIRAGVNKPPSNVKQLIETAKTNADGWVDDAPTQPKGKLSEGIYDPHADTRKIPIGTTYKVSPGDMPKPKLNEAIKLGFEYQGMTEDGKIIIKKVKQSPEPDLHMDPTTGELGVKTDIKKASPITEALNLPRGLMASMDFSAPLRQGIGLIHKRAFWEALPDMFNAWRTEEGFRGIQNEIANRPMFRKTIGADGKVQASFAEKSGLHLTDLTDLTKREESVMSTWAEKVPGVRRSNRAYTAFLNKLRADTFENLVNDSKLFGPDVKANQPLANALADFVNTATGRGSLGKLERAAVPLNTMFFAPRLIAARLKMLNPAYYIMAPPQVRKEAVKSLFALAVTGNTLLGLGKMAGGEVSMDPSNSDFMKLKVGNTRIDPWAGFQQYIVAANRLLNPAGPATGFEGETPITRGQMTTSSTTGREYDIWNPKRPFDPVWSDIAERFGRGKLNPVLGFAVSLAKGAKEMSGKPMNFTAVNPFGVKGENIMDNAIAQRFIPILAQDFWDLAQSNELPLPVKAAVGIGSMFGMGQQTYGEEQ